MAIDARKHVAPAGGETPRRQAINDLSLSINDVVPVANVTERAQLVADLTSAGAPPSSTRPLVVARADAFPGAALEVTQDGVTWYAIGAGSAWAPYSPSLTATSTNPNLGTGATATGAFQVSGGILNGYFSIQFGTGSSSGSGTYRVSIPSPVHPDLLDSFMPVGSVRLRDDSAPTERIWALITVPGNANVLEMRSTGETGATQVTNNVPWTWAPSDRIRGTFTLRVAA